jgi:hypothetical protein
MSEEKSKRKYLSNPLIAFVGFYFFFKVELVSELRPSFFLGKHSTS